MITLTDRAAFKIKNNLTKRGKGLGIRLGVKTTGCSGLSYVLEYADNYFEGDHIFETCGIHLYLDSKSLIYLDGMSIDYVKKGLNEGFEFINPNEKNKCGCGESFNV